MILFYKIRPTKQAKDLNLSEGKSVNTPMIVYEVKLICSQTKEVLYTFIGEKAQLPKDELMRRLPKPVLVITTLDSNGLKKKETKAA